LNKGADVNAQGERYGNALQAASFGGHQEIVKLLLNKEADVNAQGGLYGNALQAASLGGHQEIVKLLQRRAAITLSSKRSGSRTTRNPAKKLRLMLSEPPGQDC
jgi:ankyrin repeat protein